MATDPPDVDVVRAEARKRVDRGLTITRMAEHVGLSAAAIGGWLRGTYAGDVQRVTGAVARWLRTDEDLRSMRGAAYQHVDLAVTGELELWCRHAQANADIVVICGAAGAGKSWSLARYAEAAAAAWLVTMSPSLTTAAAVLSRVARALGTGAGQRTAARLEQAVIDRLRDIDAVLLVDEANHLSQPLIDVLRCVHDGAGCGLVLCGNTPLWARLASGDRAALAAQLVSRVGLHRCLKAAEPHRRDHARRAPARAAGGWRPEDGPRGGGGPRRPAGDPQARRPGADAGPGRRA